MAEQAASDNGALRFLTDVWPLVALAIIGAVIVRACVPTVQAPTAVENGARLDASTTERSGNAPAMAALSAVTVESSVEQAMAALNQVSIDFPNNGSTLPAGSDAILTQVATAISARPGAERYEVSARADGALSPLADLELSRRRSQAVVDFLVNQGVPSGRLQALAIGDPAPVTSEAGHESAPRNPHLQFTLLP